MADQPNETGYTAEELRASKGDFDPAALAAGQAIGADTSRPAEKGAPQPTGGQIAEDQRRQEQARPDGHPDRDDKLVNIGRGHDTTGRGSQR